MFTHMILSSLIYYLIKRVTQRHYSTLREVVLIPNRHWGGEGLLGCVFGCVFIIQIPYFCVYSHLIIEYRFGLLHRIPPQPEDRLPGTIPPELQEQGDEYGSQDLFIPADVDESQHTHGHTADWQRQEQNQWNHESIPKSKDGHAATQAGHDHHSHDHEGLSLQ